MSKQNCGGHQKRQVLPVRFDKPAPKPRGITSVISYASLLHKLLAKLPIALNAMKDANELHNNLLKQVIENCCIGAKGDSEFALTAPDARGELYYIEKRLRQEREVRLIYILSDFYTVLLFCKNIVPPNRDMVIKAKSRRVRSLNEAIEDVPKRLKAAQELYSIKASELSAKHEEQMKNHKKCVRILLKLLGKENNYVNILVVMDGGLKTIGDKGRKCLSETTPDLAKEFRRVVDRHIEMYMQQRQKSAPSPKSGDAQANKPRRGSAESGRNPKLDELRAVMEQLASRVVPPGIQIKELNFLLVLRAERATKIDQMDKNKRELFRQLVRFTQEEPNVSKSTKELFSTFASYLSGAIEELVAVAEETKAMRELISNKLQSLATIIKKKKEECKPFKRIVRRIRPSVMSLRQEMVMLSQVEAELRYKLRQLIDHLNQLEKQKSDVPVQQQPTAVEVQQVDDDDEIRLHSIAIEKVDLRISCIEKDREIKDLLDLINRKRCHIKLQLGHLNKELNLVMDEIENRSGAHDLYKVDNARLEKYVLDNEKFIKNIDQAIEKCQQQKEDEKKENDEIERLENECSTLEMIIEELIVAPEKYYPIIRELEREIDAIKGRKREKNRNLRKMEKAKEREKEVRDQMRANREAPDQLPNLMETDMQSVVEEVKALQGRFEEVFTKNIELKSRMIEQESMMDRYRRNIARLETDLAMKELEMDKITCRMTAKERTEMFCAKYKIERGKYSPPSPPGREAAVPAEAPGPSYAEPPKLVEPPPPNENWRHLYERRIYEGDTSKPAGEDDTELYVEEVRVKTTRTIRASQGFIRAHGVPSPMAGFEGAQQQHETQTDKQYTAKEQFKATTKETQWKDLMSETKIPGASAVKEGNEPDSPEATWVSYTDGRDIPTVLKSDLDQGTEGVLKRIKVTTTVSKSNVSRTPDEKDKRGDKSPPNPRS